MVINSEYVDDDFGMENKIKMAKLIMAQVTVTFVTKLCEFPTSSPCSENNLGAMS